MGRNEKAQLLTTRKIMGLILGKGLQVQMPLVLQISLLFLIFLTGKKYLADFVTFKYTDQEAACAAQVGYYSR